MTALGAATVLRGDARALPLPDASVDLVVTSPPYFALRSYTDGGEHYAGQIGGEPTPGEYIASLIACTAEWVRVLKPGGSIWVNLGDKYGRPGGGADRSPRSLDRAGRGTTERLRTATDGGGRDKCLMGLPWRYALRCIDELDLILRAEVVWSKPSALPESVTDRVRRTHEQWFHLTREQRYYSAVDMVRKPHAAATVKRAQPHRAPVTGTRDAYQSMPAQTIHRDQSMNPLGALPGSVWDIPTEPLDIPDHIAHARCCGGIPRSGCEDGLDHFAAFPTEWPRRIILGWSPSGVCAECGEGRRPVAEIGDRVAAGHGQREASVNRRRMPGSGRNPRSRHGETESSSLRTAAARTITGETCACLQPTAATRPAVVLDPFGGTGTTALMAKALGRHGISLDRSADYGFLATWRTTDAGQLAKAMRVPKPPVESDGQLDMFDLDGADAA